MNNQLSTSEKGLYRRVDEILFYLWDPIGVCDIPMARDEYQSYLPKVFKLLINDSKDHEVSAYLLKLNQAQWECQQIVKKHLKLPAYLLKLKKLCWSNIPNK